MAAMRRKGPRAGAAAAQQPQAQPASTTLTAPLGQGRALERMLRAARKGRLHHAVVVSGPPGSGKSTVVRWLAAALLCPSDLDADGPCTVCRTCRRVQTGQHPDLHVLEPEPDKREIRVDAVRELRDALLHHPVEGGARVVLIDPASALNEEGQNALLKTLEEPGAATWLLLATSRPEALLPTVRSRCERLGVRRLEPAVVAAELSRRLPDRAALHDRALTLADGRLGAALDACTEHAVQIHDLVQQLCTLGNPLRVVATARAVLTDSDGQVSAQLRARALLAALRSEACRRLRALAAAGDGSYVLARSEPWTDLLTLTLAAEQDLDVQIPPEQALVGLLLEWSRSRPGGA